METLTQNEVDKLEKELADLKRLVDKYLQQLEGVKIPYNVIVDYLEPMKQAVKED